MGWFERLKRVLSETTVEVVLLGVGATMTMLSVWYTALWHLETGDSLLVAVSFSASFVVFLVILFEFGVKVALDGKAVKAALILVAWGVLVTYSMQSTVASQYAGVSRRRIENADEMGRARSVGNREAVLGERIASRRAAIEEMESVADELRERILSNGTDGRRLEPSWVVDRWQKSLDGALADIRDGRAGLDDLLVSKSGLVEQAGVAEERGQQDVFAFYEDVLGIEANRVEFGLAVFKGVILDTANVVCFMVVMMREKWKKDEEEERERKEEERQKDPEVKKQSAMEKLAELAFGNSRNGMFPSEKRVREEVGIGSSEYARIVKEGIMKGVLVRRGGRVYRVKGTEKEEFLNEIG